MLIERQASDIVDVRNDLVMEDEPKRKANQASTDQKQERPLGGNRGGRGGTQKKERRDEE